MPLSSPPVRPPLLRPQRGRRVGGVCQGLAIHLDQPVRRVRLIFLVATLFAGAGALLYIWLWVTVPGGDPVDAAVARSAVRPRLAERLSTTWQRFPVTDVAVGLLMLIAAGVIVAGALGWRVDLTILIPIVVVGGGLALAWSQLERSDAARPGGRTPVSVLRLVAAIVLVALGVLALATQGGNTASMVRSALAALAVVAGIALALAPWWLRLLRALGDERAERARQTERADIAAHLHDSVLQTLVLIRARAANAEEVAKLARHQERELRAWLYSDRAPVETSLAEQLRTQAGSIEDIYGVDIDLVVVGDARPDERTDALERATAEALTNAVRHGRPPVSAYAEVREDGIDVFVRDRGDGFDLADIAPDRYGVRESIIGRLERVGGSAEVVSESERGTEVRLHLPIEGGNHG